MDFESSFKSHLKKRFEKAPYPTQKLLRKALFYSLFSKASRFRPKLCFATAKALNQDPKKILPWAIAIEMIHGASLIHDDLPAMDNSKTRRGKKCSHLLFGEDIALLAGTCLFVESFLLLADPLFNKKRSPILKLFISKIGFYGLMGGQALDLRFNFLLKKDFLKMIQLKTGALIEASVLGPVVLWGKNKTERKIFEVYAKNMGIAYQLADDMKDKDSFFKSKRQAIKELKAALYKSENALKPLGTRGEELKHLSSCLQKRILTRA